MKEVGVKREITIAIILIAVIIFAYCLFHLERSKDIQTSVPIPVFTDNNDGENLIIKTDQQNYNVGSSAEVYFSLSNIGTTSQNFHVQLYFPKNVQVSLAHLQHKINGEWEDIELSTTRLSQPLTYKKSKPIPSNLEVKNSFDFPITSNEIDNFRVVINFQQDSQGEFWVEGIGDKGGYGLLDPGFISHVNIRGGGSANGVKVRGGGGGGGGVPSGGGDVQLASDNFNRSDESPLSGGGVWTGITGEGTLDVASNEIVANNSGADSGYYYNAITWPDDQYSQITFRSPAAGGGGQGYGVVVRAAAGAATYYRLVGDSSGTLELGKRVAGSYSVIWDRSTTVSDGDTLKLSVRGNILRAYVNGSQIGGDIFDSSITSGNAGISYSSVDSGGLDDWQGGSSTPTNGVFEFIQAGAICDTAIAASVSCPFTGTVTAGSLLVMVCGLAPGDVSSITDGGSNTWAAYPTGGKTYESTIWYAVAATGGFTSITIHFSPNSKASCRPLEFSTGQGTLSTDVSSKNTGTSAAPTGNVLTPTASGDLFLAVSTGFNTPVQTLNWSGAVDEGLITGGSYGNFGAAYKIVSSLTAQTPAWTLGGSNDWGVAGAAFKISFSSGGGGVKFR